MICARCATRPATVGVLCEACSAGLADGHRVTPEQLQLRASAATRAALIDAWGQVHRLPARAVIGRQLAVDGLAVLDASISREHAELALDPDGRTWRLRDLGSANGTYVGEVAVDGPREVRDGDRLRFGRVAFAFVEDAARLPVATAAGRLDATRATTRLDLAALALPAPEGGADVDHGPDPAGAGPGPARTFRLSEPTGGGGGVVEVDGTQVQLTTTQFEFLALMIRRMTEETHQPELVRGFVRSSELIAELSWDTSEPSENHVKQLVRRVRRALVKAGVGDLIESRHRFGYRLRAVPRLA